MGEPDEYAAEAAKSATIRRKPVPVPQPAPAPSKRANLFQRWKSLSKRNRIIIISVVLALLILIIGLAAGLSTRHKTQNLPLPSGRGGPYTGDLTYYDPGLGACGVTSKNGDHIVAVSHIIYDAVSTSSDPNANPLCGKKIRARKDNKSVDLTVVDRCTGCEPTDIDITMDVFASLADIDQGRVPVEWNWLEDVPANAQR